MDGVENSIIPAVEKYEEIENLPVEKFSKNQFLEMKSILKRKDERIRVMTYNILFNYYDHNLDEVNRWPQRLPRIVEVINEIQPDIIGVQELYPDQLNDLKPHLEEDFAFYAMPCEDGELNGIFYRKGRFKVLERKVWYTVNIPDHPGSETLTMLKVKDLMTGKCFAVFNTHLAFSKVEKRSTQVHFIADKVASYAEKIPVFLTGDMNTFPNRLDLDKLPFYDGDYVQRILTRKYLRDAKDVSLLGHLGPISTFSNGADDGVPFTGTGTPGVFLDHIYVSKGVSVILHAVQPGTVDGHYPSDHLPVLIDCIVD
jgi:endonuclease/exonuclease/phosphatase family metal-dependent hydrolase